MSERSIDRTLLLGGAATALLGLWASEPALVAAGTPASLISRLGWSG